MRWIDVAVFYFRTRNRRINFAPTKHRGHIYEDLAAVTAQPTLFYDISAISSYKDARGIHRVVHKILEQLSAAAKGYQVVTVKSTRDGLITCGEKGHDGDRCHSSGLNNYPINVKPGDIFISLDLYRKFNFKALQELRLQGLKTYFVVHDLLDLRSCCLGDSDLTSSLIAHIARRTYRNWLHGVLSTSDGIICVSKSIADELLDWLNKKGIYENKNLQIGFFYLGADFINLKELGTYGVPDCIHTTLNAKNKPIFLMVGVMDPHKGHAQVIQAFETLWSKGLDVILVIVGKVGLLQPSIKGTIINHREYGNRLFWFEFVDDAALVSLYSNSTALLAASFSEGFGLPLIEAAYHGLPIIARDIPIFREVAGQHAFYFENTGADAIADAIVNWLALAERNEEPKSVGMAYRDWFASTYHLLDIINNNKWYALWPTSVHNLAQANDLPTNNVDCAGIR
ncbi:glycosyltransferase family 4 protein [Acidithiobacillus caldus]|nr:glycosyltransferase family 1 protein [Acidithiobacillus caldus]